MRQHLQDGRSSYTIVTDRVSLVAALRQRGIEYLAPSDAAGDRPLDDESLIASLACHDDCRVRQALIALFLLEPDLSRHVARLEQSLPPAPACELVAYYMAAVYLQTMWSVRLRRYLGRQPALADEFSTALGLPDRCEGLGKVGLHALSDWHNARLRTSANRLSEYEGVVDLLFADLKRRHRR